MDAKIKENPYEIFRKTLKIYNYCILMFETGDIFLFLCNNRSILIFI